LSKSFHWGSAEAAVVIEVPIYPLWHTDFPPTLEDSRRLPIPDVGEFKSLIWGVVSGGQPTLVKIQKWRV